jgi:hypothetical protein
LRSALVVVALAVTACGGGSAPEAAPSLVPSPTPTSAAPGGLINDVKQASVVAVCTDLKQASELVGTGLADDQVRAAVDAAIGQLEKPPHPNGSLILARALRQEVRRHRLDAAVNTGLAWCTAHGA